MKQPSIISLSFIFCVLGLMFSTTQALGGFQPNIVAKQQTEINQENHSIEKSKRIVKEEVQRNRKSRKRFRKLLKTTDKYRIIELSITTLVLGILGIFFLTLAVMLDLYIFLILFFVAAIVGIIIGIKSLVRVKKSNKDHKADKIISIIGLSLNLISLILVSIVLIILLTIYN